MLKYFPQLKCFIHQFVSTCRPDFVSVAPFTTTSAQSRYSVQQAVWESCQHITIQSHIPQKMLRCLAPTFLLSIIWSFFLISSVQQSPFLCGEYILRHPPLSSGCLKPQTVPNSIYPMFFLYMHTVSLKGSTLRLLFGTPELPASLLFVLWGISKYNKSYLNTRTWIPHSGSDNQDNY